MAVANTLALMMTGYILAYGLSYVCQYVYSTEGLHEPTQERFAG